MSDMMKVSSNPHVRSGVTTSNIMMWVVIALLPAAGFGIYNFGIDALIILVLSVASTVLTEFIYEILMQKKVTIGDFSAVVTGLLLGMNLPCTAPWWLPIIGGVFAILVVKMLFGGLGQNFMNPALGARCFLLISFPALMTNFTTDTYTSPTPLAALKAGLSAAEAELISAQKDLLNTKIVAPMAGRIGKNDASVGNYVTPSSGPLTSIVQLDPHRLQVTVSNRDFLEMFGDENGLRENSVIRIKLADDTWYPYDGEVDFIGNEANRKTDSVWIYVKIKNPDYKLLPGSTVTVMISKKNGPAHVAVSPAAVMHDANGAYVYVVDDQNKANRRDVVTDFSTGEQQIIKSGLEAGEKVVTAGILKIMMPGMTVVPQENGAKQQEEVPQVKKEEPVAVEDKSSN